MCKNNGVRCVNYVVCVGNQEVQGWVEEACVCAWFLCCVYVPLYNDNFHMDKNWKIAFNELHRRDICFKTKLYDKGFFKILKTLSL